MGELKTKSVSENSIFWDNSNIQVFWGEIAPCDHLVQIYENDIIFLNTLEGFVGDGFLKNESVIVIATPEHIHNLNLRLINQGFDIDALKATDQYILMDASDAAAEFMLGDWPDDKLFTSFVSSLFARAQSGNRKVRVFGEIVSVLWHQGHTGATVQLENLWHRLQHENRFCLYCAYPKSGFTQDSNASLEKICNAHSKVIDGETRPSTEVYYINVRA
jgi:hypothetical protein